MALLITFKWYLPLSKESLGAIFEIALLFFFKNNICFDRNEKIMIFYGSKQMLFLKKKKGAISKIAPKMSLKRGRRYLNIINSAFLFPPHPESFENEIAPLKTFIAFSFFKNACFLCKLKNFSFWNMSFQRRYFVFKAFPIRGQ